MARKTTSALFSTFISIRFRLLNIISPKSLMLSANKVGFDESVDRIRTSMQSIRFYFRTCWAKSIVCCTLLECVLCISSDIMMFRTRIEINFDFHPSKIWNMIFLWNKSSLCNHSECGSICSAITFQLKASEYEVEIEMKRNSPRKLEM